jgi:UDPglucose 6-dehydrogenase
VLRADDAANTRQKRVLFTKLSDALGGTVAGTRVAVWGLAFKAQTDDVRESPALALIDALLEAGAEVVAHDPVAIESARTHFGARPEGCRVRFSTSSYAATHGADALVIATDWNEYRTPNFRRIRESLARPVIVDGRNLYEPERMASLGFNYHSIGRATMPALVPTQ